MGGFLWEEGGGGGLLYRRPFATEAFNFRWQHPLCYMDWSARFWFGPVPFFFFGSHYSHIIAAPKIVEKSQKNQENMNKKGKGMGMGMEMGMSMEMEMEKVMG